MDIVLRGKQVSLDFEVSVDSEIEHFYLMDSLIDELDLTNLQKCKNLSLVNLS